MSMPQPTSRFVLNDDGNIVDMRNRFPLVPASSCAVCQQLTSEERSDPARLRRCVLKSLLSSLTGSLGFFNEAQAYALGQVIYWTIYVSGVDLLISRAASAASIEDMCEVREPSAPPEFKVLSPFLEELENLLRDVYDDCDADLLGDVIEAIRLTTIQWDRARTAMSRNFLQRSRRGNEIIDYEEIVSLAALQRKIDLSSVHGDVCSSDTEALIKGLDALNPIGVPMLGMAAKLLEGKPYGITTDNPKTIRRCLPLAEFMGASVQRITEVDGLTNIVFGPPSQQ